MSTAGSSVNHILSINSYTLKRDDGESWGDKVNGSWTGLVGAMTQKVPLSIIKYLLQQKRKQKLFFLIAVKN